MGTTEATLKRRARKIGFILCIDKHDGKHRARLKNSSGEMVIHGDSRDDLMRKVAEKLK